MGRWVLVWVALVAPALARPPGTGVTVEVRVEHAAHTARGAPSAVVHAPPGFSAEGPLHLVVFLHGYMGCARALMVAGEAPCREGGPPRQGWGLAGHHDAAGTNTLFVIPQLALRRRDGDPGCFAREGCFARFLGELLTGPLSALVGEGRGLDDVASITLVAHSAGYRTALAILQRGGVEAQLRHVVLFDALYGGAEGFARWLRETPVADPRLVSVYLGDGKTRRGSRRLLRLLRRAPGISTARADASGLARAIASRSLVIATGAAPHRRVPERHLAEVLAALPGLPKRGAAGAPDAQPAGGRRDLRSTLSR
ncbi:MAG: alpha/beta hydrolase [Myxococcales bacterium]|jgi:hypothetical protein